MITIVSKALLESWVLQHDGAWTGIEITRTDAPRMTPSIRNALDDLALDQIIVAHAGHGRFSMASKVDAIGAAELLAEGLP